MKLIRKTLLALGTAFLGTCAVAQSNNIPQVQHVIIVIQENRTPDNLFNQDTTLYNNGGDIRPNYQHEGQNTAPPCNLGGSYIALQGADLYTCYDTQHNHATPTPDWLSMWDFGAMDGACGIAVNWRGNPPSKPYCGTTEPPCVTNSYGGLSTCSYAYVENSLWNSKSPYDQILDPYFQIANQYGWANRMFQTNQGPSFPAHQFLFSGTSAPVAYNDPNKNCINGDSCWQWFNTENTSAPHDPNSGDDSGCLADEYEYNGTVLYAYAWLEDPNGVLYQSAYNPPSPVSNPGFPCYDHPTLSDLLDNAKITWRYYARSEPQLWTAPTAIDHLCSPSGYGPSGGCTGTAYLPVSNEVVVPPAPPGDQAAILTDIENCNLAQVSWVIPDGHWSDHAGGPPDEIGDGGPSWVGNIVNAVGGYGPPSNNCGYWDNTVILVVWDDWGGYYDHVPPLNCGPNQPCGYYNATGGNGKQYVYGFRVPLLAVSAYAVQTNSQPPNYTGYVSPYNHDFGSILNFIEYAFGTGGTPLGGAYGIGSQYWPYADYYAPDTASGGGSEPYGLADFFTYSQSNPTPIPFRVVNGVKYQPYCFHTPNQAGCFTDSYYPLDPDNDANESD